MDQGRLFCGLNGSKNHLSERFQDHAMLLAKPPGQVTHVVVLLTSIMGSLPRQSL